jgi:hypothetical protein
VRLHRAASAALLVGLASSLLALPARPASAGTDVCPEPNNALAAACFLGPGGAAAGFLDTAEDVDSYKIELPADKMIVATISALPGDYTLHLRLADGSLKAEAIEPGVADKTVKADGLTAGTYFLTVDSPRGAFSADAPYMISVTFADSLVIATPAGSTGTANAYGFIPGPASTYLLQPADVPWSFDQVQRRESDDKMVVGQALVAKDAFVCPNVTPDLPCSNSGPGMILTTIFVEPYGSNEVVAAEYEKALSEWRSRGYTVEPAVGWGSERVFSFAQGTAGIMFRGIALQHRNVVVVMQMSGSDKHATWDAIALAMRGVEKKLFAAAQ